MHRYDVQSGTLRMTIQADSVHKAALWAVHQALQQVLPGGSRVSRSPVPMVLADRVRVTRVSSDPPVSANTASSAGAATVLDTSDLVMEWNQLMVALARLDTALAA